MGNVMSLPLNIRDEKGRIVSTHPLTIVEPRNPLRHRVAEEPEKLSCELNRILLPCYKGCSEHNPHRTLTCDKLENYFKKCPTYKRLEGER